jgi:hypothetical protein
MTEAAMFALCGGFGLWGVLWLIHDPFKSPRR